jgi:hypothetical protein
MQQNKPRIRLFGVLLKATLLFVLFNFAFMLINDIPVGRPAKPTLAGAPPTETLII